MQPYATDYELVVDEIVKRTTGRPRLDSDVEKDLISVRRQDFTEEVSLMQSMETSNAQIQNLSDDLTRVEEVIKRMDQYINSGLDASVTGVNKVKVTAGYGVAYGIIQTLSIDQEVTITFDDTTPVYYLQIDKNAVVVNKYEDIKMLTVGRIIVPYPGQTTEIQDDRPWAPYGEDTGYNGWIESAKDAFFGEDTTFDDASREVVRDALSQIAAEIIFGTLTASESLKITNVHGTAVLTSRAMEFKNSDGEVVSRYGSDYARIGDIAIYPTYLESTNFNSGVSGFRIDRDGFAEFEDVHIRGVIRSSVFEYNTISATAGQLLVSNSTTLSATMGQSDSAILHTADIIFNENEIVRLKDGINDEWMRIVSVADAPAYVVERDLAQNYGPNANPAWEKATCVASYGVGDPADERTGFIVLDSISAYSPFIDIAERNSIVYNDFTTKVRVGRLDGIPGCSGWGLYSDNVFLTGVINAIGGSLTDLTISGLLTIGADGAIQSSDYVVDTSGFRLDSVAGLEVNDGDIKGTTIVADTINISTFDANTRAQLGFTRGQISGANLEYVAAGTVRVQSGQVEINNYLYVRTSYSTTIDMATDSHWVEGASQEAAST